MISERAQHINSKFSQAHFLSIAYTQFPLIRNATIINDCQLVYHIKHKKRQLIKIQTSKTEVS